MPTSDEVEVIRLFEHYEAALLRNDVDAMNSTFLESVSVLRFGSADMQFGFDELVDWRAAAAPVDPQRRMTRREVLQLAPASSRSTSPSSTGTVGDPGGSRIRGWGRGGWRIVRAHVSVLDR